MYKRSSAHWIAWLCIAGSPVLAQTGTGGDGPKPGETILVADAVRQAEAALDAIPLSGLASERSELLSKAKRLFAQIEAADPANPWLNYLRGRIWAITQSRPTFDAIGQLQTFAETHIGQSHWRVHVALGDLYADAWPMQAKSKYLRADELNPNHAKTLYGLSVCESKLGEKEAAFEYAQRAVQSASANERTRYLGHLVRLFAEERMWDEAYQAALAARGLAESRRRQEPTSPEALVNLESQLQLLIGSVRGSLGETPGDASLYMTLIEYIETLAEIRRELAAFETLRVVESAVLNTPPTRPVALEEKRVEILLGLGRRGDAIILCEKIRARSPNSTICADVPLPVDSLDKP